MEALPEELRQAVTLREIEGLSYEEIAEVMNCPIGTVRSRIFRAREAIAAAPAAAARHARRRTLVRRCAGPIPQHRSPGAGRWRSIVNDTEPGADGAQSRRERLSALMDGELDDDAAAGCCLRWRDDTDVRSSWHAYHLIGDVLRSGQHGLRGVARGQAAAGGAPSAGRRAGGARAARRRRRRAAASRGWLASAAVVAGFMAVAGVVGTIQGSPTSPALNVASTDSAGCRSCGARRPSLSPGRALPRRRPTSAPRRRRRRQQLLRDARLDRYLTAHKQFGGSSALGMPSGFLRSATLQAPAR